MGNPVQSPLESSSLETIEVLRREGEVVWNEEGKKAGQRADERAKSRPPNTGRPSTQTGKGRWGVNGGGRRGESEKGGRGDGGGAQRAEIVFGVDIWLGLGGAVRDKPAFAACFDCSARGKLMLFVFQEVAH